MMDTCFNGLQFFDDKSAAACANKHIAAAHTRIEINFNSENQKLAEELHQQIIQQIRKYNKGICFFRCY